ncbi:hypothetical protein TWF730_007226 [Orbilia blumenaviensis]|uniref:DUF7587 domain-containing protein n=1 Tax=Orbilia blumenaviensis TaxID=1796055 RepID=A0AAV9V9W6_9PEZI
MRRIPNPRLKGREYPYLLYRVHFPKASHTSYHENYGFTCTADDRIDICDYDDLANGFESHLDWGSKKPTYFISMFGSEDHAVNWAIKQIGRGRDVSASVMAIDPGQIKNSRNALLPILCLDDILSQYPDLVPDGKDKKWFEDEYLALYMIPESAIVNSYDVYFG